MTIRKLKSATNVQIQQYLRIILLFRCICMYVCAGDACIVNIKKVLRMGETTFWRGGVGNDFTTKYIPLY